MLLQFIQISTVVIQSLSARCRFLRKARLAFWGLGYQTPRLGYLSDGVQIQRKCADDAVMMMSVKMALLANMMMLSMMVMMMIMIIFIILSDTPPLLSAGRVANSKETRRKSFKSSRPHFYARRRLHAHAINVL